MPRLGNALDANSNKITNLTDPTSPQDAATKNYVDGLAGGIDAKQPAVVVSVANVALSGLQTIDGVTLSGGQRVLLPAQSTPSQNGLWLAASGAWTRPTDFASSSVQNGTYVLILAGSTYTGHGFLMTGTTAVTVDTTAQTWVEFTGATDISVTAPIVKTGNTLSLGTVPVASGGTGATTATGARTNLGATGKYAADIGNGSLTTITVNHALNTTDVTVFVYLKSSGAHVIPDIVIVDANNITVTFGVAPASNAYRVVVVG